MLSVLTGDAIERLRGLRDESVQCVVTSPPYWGLRDYSTNGQLGLERTPEEYVGKMVAVFREVRRVLRRDGTLWLNMGDSYGTKGSDWSQWKGGQTFNDRDGLRDVKISTGLKPKDLCGIPWRVAFALQADGWWLRSDIIWAKPNPMPESVTDRPTKSHEYLFLLTKSASYYYDAIAIAEKSLDAEAIPYKLRDANGSPASSQQEVSGESARQIEETDLFSFSEDGVSAGSVASDRSRESIRSAIQKIGETKSSSPSLLPKRKRSGVNRQVSCYGQGQGMSAARSSQEALSNGNVNLQSDGSGVEGNSGFPESQVRDLRSEEVTNTRSHYSDNPQRESHEVEHSGTLPELQHAQGQQVRTRNRRSVWTVATAPYAESHFATFPPDLIKPCIMAGSRVGDIVLDPFAGSGTTGMVALELGRKAVLIELNPKYVELIEQRCTTTYGLALAC